MNENLKRIKVYEYINVYDSKFDVYVNLNFPTCH